MRNENALRYKSYGFFFWWGSVGGENLDDQLGLNFKIPALIEPQIFHKKSHHRTPGVPNKSLSIQIQETTKHDMCQVELKSNPPIN